MSAKWWDHTVVTGSHTVAMHQCSISFVLWSVWSWFKLGKAWTGELETADYMYDVSLCQQIPWSYHINLSSYHFYFSIIIKKKHFTTNIYNTNIHDIEEMAKDHVGLKWPPLCKLKLYTKHKHKTNFTSRSKNKKQKHAPKLPKWIKCHKSIEG